MNDERQQNYFEGAKQFSQDKIASIRKHFNENLMVDNFNSAIFITGSFGRNEARKTSDLDLFFIGDSNNLKEESFLRRESFAMQNKLEFPEFDKGGKILKLHASKEIMENIGGPKDDAENFFTTRMLLLLESQFLFNEMKYDECKKSLIEEYFRDEKGKQDFKPTFLINDIVRYWRTICLNYEYKRGEYLNNPNVRDKIGLKLKNKKLKFNRIWLCYSGIIPLLGKSHWNKEEAVALFKKSPYDRLKDHCESKGKGELFAQAAEQYVSFLRLIHQYETNKLLEDGKNDIWAEMNGFGSTFRTKIINIIQNCSEEKDWNYLLL